PPCAGVPAEPARVRGGRLRRRPGQRPDRPAALDRVAGAPGPDPGDHALAGRVPVRPWSARPVEVPPATSLGAGAGRRGGRARRLRAGRVDQRVVRGELELARARVVPGELSPVGGPATVP